MSNFKCVVMGEILEPTGLKKPRPISVWTQMADAYYEKSLLEKYDKGSRYYVELVEYEPEIFNERD